ncbi:hypothetical protein [Micromonospora sp. NPDC049374]|uniref:hypothetical protein n=1 Tax=Micromonospora sp. NPDC049374 TaxID=3154352 RepID=UPI00341C72D8
MRVGYKLASEDACRGIRQAVRVEEVGFDSGRDGRPLHPAIIAQAAVTLAKRLREALEK